MNSRSSSAGKVYENEFSEFLIKRIANSGGSLQLHHITGHLSQVRSEVRNVIGSSKLDLLEFLKRHDNLFVINKGVVSLVNPSTISTSGYDSDNSSKSFSSLPLKIRNGKGVIIKLFSGYGFIKSKEPIKTEIFFNSLCYGDKDIVLTSFLHVGAVVFFHAKRKDSDFSCKYYAVKLWRADNNDDSGVIIEKSRKNRETGLYDPLNLESEGVIQNVFPNLGFISVKGEENNTVFFHKNRVVNYDNIVDLTKVFSKGDRVEFTAHRSSKPDAKARWEATKVWKVSGSTEQNVSQFADNQISVPKLSVSDSRPKSCEMIKNQHGKIFPRSRGAVIKFGNNELADGDSALYYVCGTQVTEIGWEFAEGDDIYFDAVKIKSAPGWKAVLVWTDTKPNIVLPTCLGDFSEFTEDDDSASLCMSESSSSSIKSENPSKAKNFKNEKTPKLSDCFVNKELRGSYKKLAKNHNTSSRDSLSSSRVSDKYCFVSKGTRKTNNKMSKNHNTSSRDSLSSLPASDNYHHLKSSENIIKFPSNKPVDQLGTMLSNWSDSPYPADEAYESMETAKSFNSDISLTCDSETKHFTENEMEDSSEYASVEEEKLERKLENEEASSQNNTLNCTASIKRYYDMKGEIKKVYFRLAEVKSNSLQNAISFSLNKFYSDGRSTDELDIDNLKDVLKVGDGIYFNCFVIIDDLGHSWHEITLAWKGFKPKYTDEIRPEDFIKQNNLSVTVNNEVNNDKVTDKVIHRKFLTSFIDDSPDNDIDNLSQTESCSEEESLTLSPKSQVKSKAEFSDDYESLLDAVCKILKRDVFSNNTIVDIKSVAEEIIAIVKSDTMRPNILTSKVLSEASCVSKALENVCSSCKEKSSSSSSVKMENIATQTLVTGDVISQNVFTA